MYDVLGSRATSSHSVREGVKVNSEYGNDYVTISDDDGNEFELEHLDTLELNEVVYMAFLPADMDEDDDDFGLIIMKAVAKDGESVLSTLDSDGELEMVYERFLERLLDDEDDE